MCPGHDEHSGVRERAGVGAGVCNLGPVPARRGACLEQEPPRSLRIPAPQQGRGRARRPWRRLARGTRRGVHRRRGAPRLRRCDAAGVLGGERPVDAGRQSSIEGESPIGRGARVRPDYVRSGIGSPSAIPGLWGRRGASGHGQGNAAYDERSGVPHFDSVAPRTQARRCSRSRGAEGGAEFG
jgi:hypothetical protein